MEHYIKHLIHFLQLHPNWGYFAAFLIAFAESLPIIGTIVPGSVTMTAVGTLIGAQVLPGSSTIIAAVIGAFCGDVIGFKVGSYFNDSLRDVWPFKKRKHLLDYGESFFKKHGIKSIIIGRFIGPVRSSVPLIAGMLNMRFVRFISAAVPSAVLWAVVYFLPGVLLGLLAMDLPPHATGQFLAYGFAYIIAAWLAIWLVQRLFIHVYQSANSISDRCWRWMSKHHGSKSLIKWMTNKAEPGDHKQLTLAFFAAVFLVLFVLYAISVMIPHWFLGANRDTFFLLQSFHNNAGMHFFAAFTALGNKVTMLAIAVLSAIYFWFSKHKRAAIYLILIAVLISIGVEFCKFIYFSPRPQGLVFIKASSSFPSGHTTLAIGVLGFLAFLVAQAFRSRFWIYAPTFIIALCVAVSRIYLGEHWLSDTIGSMLLGLGLLFFCAMAYKRNIKVPIQPRSLLVVSAIIIVCWLAYGWHNVPQTLHNDQPKVSVQLVHYRDWQQHPWQQVPLYRTNRIGHPSLPLNIQWLGNLNSIKQQLLKSGWLVAHKHTFKYALLRLASENPLYHAPLFKQLYHRQKPSLFMVKKLVGSDNILELRLWPSRTFILNQNLPIWIGTINYHIPLHKKLDQHHTMRVVLKQQRATEQLRVGVQWRVIKRMQHGVERVLIY